jgi:hypothetical protein
MAAMLTQPAVDVAKGPPVRLRDDLDPPGALRCAGAAFQKERAMQP